MHAHTVCGKKQGNPKRNEQNIGTAATTATAVAATKTGKKEL